MSSTEERWERLRGRVTGASGEGSVFGEGPLDSRLAIVGEAPGRREAEESRPFVGQAGRLLDGLLEEAGIDRSEVYVTNVVKVRPTAQSDGGRTRNRPPRAGEVREGVEVLEEELRIVGPNVLLLLGSTPAKALIRKSFKLGSDRGEPHDSSLGIPAIATYHPAYLLRLRGTDDYDRMRALVLQDMAAARERAGG